MKYVVSYYNLKYDILVMCYSTNHGEGAGLTKIQIYCGILYSLATKHLYTHIHLITEYTGRRLALYSLHDLAIGQLIF